MPSPGHCPSIKLSLGVPEHPRIYHWQLPSVMRRGASVLTEAVSLTCAPTEWGGRSGSFRPAASAHSGIPSWRRPRRLRLPVGAAAAGPPFSMGGAPDAPARGPKFVPVPLRACHGVLFGSFGHFRLAGPWGHRHAVTLTLRLRQARSCQEPHACDEGEVSE